MCIKFYRVQRKDKNILIFFKRGIMINSNSWNIKIKNKLANISNAPTLYQCQASGGGGGRWDIGRDLTFSKKICCQNPYPRAKMWGQIQLKFPTPGNDLGSCILWGVCNRRIGRYISRYISRHSIDRVSVDTSIKYRPIYRLILQLVDILGGSITETSLIMHQCFNDPLPSPSV